MGCKWECIINRAFSLKFNYKCSPLCKWAYFSSLSVSFFFLFALFHFACSLQPIMWVPVMNRNLWRDSSKGKEILPFQTPISYFIQQWLLFAERRRHREKNIPRVQLSVSSDSPAFASNIFQESNWGFYCSTVWLTLAQRQRGRTVNCLSAASIESLSWGWLGLRPPSPPPLPHVA